jgi:HEAT repeat protein
LIAKLDGAGMSERVRAKRAYEELVAIGKPALPQLLVAVRDERPWVRVWAGAALAQSRDPRAVEPSLALLQDPFYEVRKIAAWHSAGLAEFDARVAPAIAALLRDPHPDVRTWGDRTVRERLKYPRCAGEIDLTLRCDRAASRVLAFKLLLWGKNLEPVPAIERTLAEEKDWRVRSAAIRSLGEGVLPADRTLLELAFRGLGDESDEVKADAVEVIDFVLKEQARHLPEDARREFVPQLPAKLPPMLDSALPRLRGAALLLLAAHEREKLFDRALAATDDPAPETRALAFRALGRIGLKDRKVAEMSLARLSDDAPGVRRAAHAALSWVAGARFDFNPDAPDEERAKAIENIRGQVKWTE